MLDNILNELFGKIHVIFQIIKSHFGFYHPEFCKMSWCVAILCTKCWTESIDLTKCGCGQFTFKLSAYSKISCSSKKIFFEIDAAIFISWGLIFSFIKRQRCYTKHFTSTFRITASNDWRMHVHKAFVIIKFMNSKCQCMTNTKNRTKCIGAKA